MRVHRSKEVTRYSGPGGRTAARHEWPSCLLVVFEKARIAIARGQVVVVLAVDLLPVSELDPDDVEGLVDGVSFLFSDLVSDLVVSLVEDVVDAASDLRLSVMYQPDPLKMIPAGKSTRLVAPPHAGHTVIGSSVIRWRTSKRFRQDVHSYS